VTPEAGLTGARALHLLALLVLFGTPAFAFYSAKVLPDFAARRVRKAALCASVAALLGGVLWFAFTAAAMTGSLANAVDGQTLSLVAFHTGFGRLWLLRLGLNLLLIALLLLGGKGRGRALASLAGAGILLASLAWVGHGTQGEGWVGALHRTGDVLHLLAAAIWIGALVFLAAVMSEARSGRADGEWVHDLLLRFSGIGAGVVAVLALTGILNARLLMGAQFPTGIFLGQYGRILAAKIALFAAMLVLAAGNRYWWTPRLAAALAAHAGKARALSLLKASVLAETLLGFAVVGAVGWLGTLPPLPE
jgi:putative copper resistance protein D